MSAQELRTVLLRVVLDGDFLNSLRADPEGALKDYALTDDEKATLTNPTTDLLNKLGPADIIWLPPPININGLLFFMPPPIFINGVNAMTEADKQKALQLVKGIRNSVGPERFDAIMELVRQAQLGGQASSEPAGNE